MKQVHWTAGVAMLALSFLLIIVPSRATATTTYYCDGQANPGLSVNNDTWAGGTYTPDVMSGLPGDDYMMGEYPYNDSTGTPDTLCGNEDRDAMWGGAGADWMNGGRNAEYVVNGGYGPDEIHAGSEGDVVEGDVGDDTNVHGDDGPDTIRGNEGDDVLNGDADNDTINGNQGTDVANGGGGTDSCTAESVNNCEP